MKIEQHVDSLASTAEMLQALSFSQPVAFQNTLLSGRDITTVIRDAERHEASLFMLSPNSTNPTKKSAKTLANPATELLKAKPDPSSGPDVYTLLAAAEQLLQIYPVDSDSVQREIELVRHKYTTIQESLAGLEAEVEIQRRKLDALASGRDYNVEDDDEEMTQAPQQDTTIVTDEMIAAEEEEILKLEQLIEQKSRR